MVYFRALTTTARMIRHTSRLAAGLVPDHEVVLDAPDGRLSGVLAAAGTGDHRPAAALLAATREGAEWEYRDRCTGVLARFAQSRPGWFGRWQAEAAPGDPDLALLRAALAVRRAWPRADREEWLHAATPLIRAAAAAAPHDPVPWRIALDQARGLGLPHAAFETLWPEAVARSPHHSGCHVAALRYLTARCDSAGAADGGPRHGAEDAGGTGSAAAAADADDPDREESGVLLGARRHDSCFYFAERAAEAALPGSLLQALPARALLAHAGPAAGPRARAAVRTRLAGTEAEDPAGLASPGRIDAAVELAIGMSARYAPGDPWPAEVRNVLALVLILRGRWEDALHQFRLIGPHATAFPWSAVSDDPLGQFLEMRDGTRLQVAAGMPLWRRGPRAVPPGQ
ncbi:hypothetical protein KBZ10_15845 [Streptomyces sp. F63]|uniref:hypothetical protein n=1 Tax=Streptomyces sp. F63 TaxID=2824887 RepID=UPI001B36D985|nr:hypothetical protein [Streptomyces sp. F63]MBQ0985964.1 hypothetical protein [Streptomyces sp. F63]